MGLLTRTWWIASQQRCAAGSDLAAPLQAALPSYTGNRDLDADPDGYWEDRWIFDKGSVRLDPRACPGRRCAVLFPICERQPGLLQLYLRDGCECHSALQQVPFYRIGVRDDHETRTRHGSRRPGSAELAARGRRASRAGHDACCWHAFPCSLHHAMRLSSARNSSPVLLPALQPDSDCPRSSSC